MTSSEMKQLVRLAQSYDRAELLAEKNTRLQAKISKLEQEGAGEGFVALYKDQLRQQEKQMKRLLAESSEAHRRLWEILGEVPDEYIYQILTRHYLSGHSWVRIAMSLGGKNSADGVRKTAARYLKKLPVKL